VPKFELYKHNDELFNIHYGICYELWTFAYFDRWCKLEKRGNEIKKKSPPLKLLSQSQPNLVEMILGWSPFKIVSISAVLYPRWPPLLKIEISSCRVYRYLPYQYKCSWQCQTYKCSIQAHYHSTKTAIREGLKNNNPPKEIRREVIEQSKSWLCSWSTSCSRCKIWCK
jgi:hypothetical protein